MKEEIKEVVKRTMKQFNKTIQIEVSVDTIANQLLNTMDNTNPHSVLITETIVGTLCAENRLGMLYNSLNGWEDVIDFKIGQKVHCTATQYSGSRRVPIGNCEIVQIDKYKSSCQIQVRYEYLYNEESKSLSENTKWVEISTLSEPIKEHKAVGKINLTV